MDQRNAILIIALTFPPTVINGILVDLLSKFIQLHDNHFIPPN
jgi:hypothetical protein